MSDTNEGGNEAKSSAWTEAAKYQFLLRIIAQLHEEGRVINWSKINMPGRTTKSLQNTWTKVRKEIAALESTDTNGDSAPTTPKKATPRKRTKKDANDGLSDDDDGPTPKKTKATPRKALPRGKRAKKEEIDEFDGASIKAEDGAGS